MDKQEKDLKKEKEEKEKKRKKKLEQQQFKNKYFEFYDDIKISDRQDW